MARDNWGRLRGRAEHRAQLFAYYGRLPPRRDRADTLILPARYSGGSTTSLAGASPPPQRRSISPGPGTVPSVSSAEAEAEALTKALTEAEAEALAAAWARAFAHVVDRTHLATGDELSAIVDDAVRPLGLRTVVLVADLAQQVLTPLTAQAASALSVDGTLAGRCYQTGQIIAGGDPEQRVLWVPILDGTERVGVMRADLPDPACTDPATHGDPDEQTQHVARGGGAPLVATDGPELRRWLWSLAGMTGHVVMTKLVYSDRLRRIRSNGPLSPASELLWQLLPPRTFATDNVVVAALLEPHDQVAGDAYDYNSDGRWVDLAVFDGVGHDLPAGLTTAVAITAIRNARRSEETDLLALAARADELLTTTPGAQLFVTAALARLDTTTGRLRYLLAGHPPPLLVREGHVVKELAAPPRPPLGIHASGDSGPGGLVAEEQLQPGDRLLLYTDGITEARDAAGEFFGEQRLVELTERTAADRLPAPETLRRLSRAVLEHQGGKLQDDATLLLVEWSSTAKQTVLPSSI
ncbi:PP2C family protein-serine/threonine phosphatase [Pseudonocardia halophobica]|uniref:PP2C family protein-serine/threonine phosphatase n=1 Tax=Pseudonocardia halophobica TaxID=29401 RepID=UPI003D8FEF1D